MSIRYAVPRELWNKVYTYFHHWRFIVQHVQLLAKIRSSEDQVNSRRQELLLTYTLDM